MSDADDWASQPLVPVPGCPTHRPFPTSYCTDCRAMFDAANPNWQGPYHDEIVHAGDPNSRKR